MCFCDPLMPAFLTQTADQQRYDPEWMAATLGPTDQLLRYSKPDQWAHAISNVGAFPSKDKNEAYQAFKLADPKGEPKEEFYSTAYALVLELFNGLQAAGPRLTPSTFELGMFSLPPSGTGQFGTWAYGTGAFTPGIDTQLGWWSNSATQRVRRTTGRLARLQRWRLLPVRHRTPGRVGPARLSPGLLPMRRPVAIRDRRAGDVARRRRAPHRTGCPSASSSSGSCWARCRR